MPNRILKEGICTSESIEKLKNFEEVFYYRLIVNCDDYGRFDARPAILRARLFPLKERLTLKDVSNALLALADVGIVRLYEVDSKPYLYLPTWDVHQTIRAKKSKYPAPPDPSETPCADKKSSEIICKQLQADAPVIQSNPNPNPNPIRSTPLPPFPGGWSETFAALVRDWFAYKAEKRQEYKPTGAKQLVTKIAGFVTQYGEAVVSDIITRSMAANYQGIVWDWLKRPQKPEPKQVGTVPKNARKNAEWMRQMLAQDGGDGDE